MKLPRFKDTYRKQTSELLRKLDRKEAMSEAVGGAFEAIGQLEAALLRQQGLRPEDTLIDVAVAADAWQCSCATTLPAATSAWTW